MTKYVKFIVTEKIITENYSWKTHNNYQKQNKTVKIQRLSVPGKRKAVS